MSAYSAAIDGCDSSVTVERDGLRLGSGFLDFADVRAVSPIRHSVRIDTVAGVVVISMLGFAFDGFFEELMRAFGARSLEALFVEGVPAMACEGEFRYAGGQGRGLIHLYADSVCILPQTERACRIPLCFATDVTAEGYLARITLDTGETFEVGRMGYDTKPFVERLLAARRRVQAERAAALEKLTPSQPFQACGLFRTDDPAYWQAAYAGGRCAVELFTGDAAATYLYRFDGAQEEFAHRLAHAMEAMGPHREIIFMPEPKLAENPLCRMAVVRAPAVGFLRARSAGRIIHNAGWEEKLTAFLA